jgi:hypothetical protein
MKKLFSTILVLSLLLIGCDGRGKLTSEDKAHCAKQADKKSKTQDSWKYIFDQCIDLIKIVENKK